MLSYDIESELLTVLLHNSVLSDHFVISFEFTLFDYTTSEKKFIYSRWLSECCNLYNFNAYNSEQCFPLKKNAISQKRLAPWYYAQLCALKQTARKMERKWRSSNLEESQLVCKDSLLTYKKALRKAGTAYYSSVIDENKNNPRFLFSTVARLTKSPSSVEPCIPLTLSSDAQQIWNRKFNTLRVKINTFPGFIWEPLVKG